MNKAANQVSGYLSSLLTSKSKCMFACRNSFSPKPSLIILFCHVLGMSLSLHTEAKPNQRNYQNASPRKQLNGMSHDI